MVIILRRIDWIVCVVVMLEGSVEFISYLLIKAIYTIICIVIIRVSHYCSSCRCFNDNSEFLFFLYIIYYIVFTHMFTFISTVGQYNRVCNLRKSIGYKLLRIRSHTSIANYIGNSNRP